MRLGVPRGSILQLFCGKYAATNLIYRFEEELLLLTVSNKSSGCFTATTHVGRYVDLHKVAAF